MTLDQQQIKFLQAGGIDWNGERLKVDGDYGPKTQWWHGISTLPELRIRVIKTALMHNGIKEDTGRPNRSTTIDRIQKPGGLGLGNPWCIAFVSAVLRDCSVSWPVYHMSAYELLKWAKAEGRITTEPLPGDLFAFLYDTKAVGFTPGHGGFVLGANEDWIADVDGNVGDSVKVGKRARQGLTFIRTVVDERIPLIMPPLKDLVNLDGARTR